MTIPEIYDKYLIPTNLQEHMLRVAGVGKVIVDNFKEYIEEDVIVKTLLLHDMGNIIKFKFDDISMLSDEDKGRVEELRAMREKFIKKYGKDCDEATLKIIAEITDDKRLVEICARSHGEYAHKFVQTDEWDLKIAYYCDMRVGPFGVLDVNTRFDDLEKRYAAFDHDEFLKLRRYRNECLLIQEQIQNETIIDLEDINDAMVNHEIKELKKMEV